MMQPRVIAMYLPQFYRNPDNDAWWGNGFTDWVSAQNAKPLFDGHYQPHIPLNKNYYDLLDKKTIEWQSNLMHKYGIDGICMYHYWFKDGRRVLEKPEQNLLNWKDIDMPFCFCWANETWARSWAKIKSANIWYEQNESQDDGDDGILLLQEYGDENAWKEHFMYLLPFFKDDRYIKVDNKPVFMIYKTAQIYCLKEMLDCWRKLADENGLDGLYILGNNCEAIEDNIIDAQYIHEPSHANSKAMQGMYGDRIKRLLYTEVWNEILSSSTRKDKVYYGGFVGYDDSPRRGEQGIIIENSTPQLFGGFLAQLLAKNEACGNDITFINAWNEWGEGMHIEPDEKYGYGYLEQIRYAKSVYRDFSPYYLQRQDKDEEDRNQKHELYLNDLDKWMRNREAGKHISDWLVQNGYSRVAVYGYGIMGRHLLTELIQDEKVTALYLVDKKRQTLNDGIRSYLPSEKLPDVDVIVVSSYYFFDSIKNSLPINQTVISLRDIIVEQHEAQCI